MERQTEFDIALSYAGEDREYVEQVATILKAKGVSVFYDKLEEVALWGKNLYDSLTDIYNNKAYYTIVFISKHYRKKMWTNLERQAMLGRELRENREYVLPARFDDTDIPGIIPTISYISLIDKSPEDFCEIIIRKLIISGRTVPSEQTRSNLSQINRVHRPIPTEFVIRVKNENTEPINGVNVLLIANNNTFLSKTTNVEGEALFTVNVLRQYKLYAASLNSPAYIIDTIEANENIDLVVQETKTIGSIICNSTGCIPGLKGRLNPIRDSENRMYLYANNIAIDGGKPQPVTFTIGVPMALEDCDGVIMQVTIIDIQGSISLIEFVKPTVSD